MKSTAVVKRIMASDAEAKKRFKLRLTSSAHNHTGEITDIA
jgi:hypothetical protein